MGELPSLCLKLLGWMISLTVPVTASSASFPSCRVRRRGGGRGRSASGRRWRCVDHLFQEPYVFQYLPFIVTDQVAQYVEVPMLFLLAALHILRQNLSFGVGKDIAAHDFGQEWVPKFLIRFLMLLFNHIQSSCL